MLALTLTFETPARFLDDRGSRAGFVLLAAFLLSFLFIRTSARLIRSPRVTWWPGSVTTSSGLHLHHLVWGIVTLMLSGLLEFALEPGSPWNEVLAALFGVGAGLTLDEFALWIYLRDVYWAEEGRASFDAVVVAATLGGLIVLGVAPFDLPRNGAPVGTLALSAAGSVLLAALAILKGKPLLGLVGIFIPLFSIAGVCRLAAPRSPWARRFYQPGSRKLERSSVRFGRIAARRLRMSNAIAGAPSAGASPDGGDAAG
ncbi:MAG TPA: hypothetical protein VFW29_05055 [Solirubrobacteraceae bacterium]|nr:hypothetical protein [Solirubrobacteraceae bacterium]